MQVIVLPPGPRCARCGHVACPCCGDWCDTLVHVDGEAELCCEGACELDAHAVELWRATFPTFERPCTIRVADTSG